MGLKKIPYGVRNDTFYGVLVKNGVGFARSIFHPISSQSCHSEQSEESTPSISAFLKQSEESFPTALQPLEVVSHTSL
jgi:hypothetical protein